MADRKRKRAFRRRKLSEAEVRHIVRDEMVKNADELVPHVLQGMLESERKRPGKLVAIDKDQRPTA